MAAVQHLLERWADDDDRPALGEAIEALTREWTPIIVRLLPGGRPEEVEDVLQSALEELVIDKGERAPRAMAPRDANRARAWRRKVLKHWVASRIVRRRRRDHAVRGVEESWSPETERSVWKRRNDARRANVDPEPTFPREVSAPPPLRADFDDLVGRREELLRMVPRLPVRRRVLVLLAMRADPSPHAAELARAIGDEPAAVLARIEHALTAPHDANHDFLSGAMVRVVYPEPHPFEKARESARRAFERAIKDLCAWVARDRGPAPGAIQSMSNDDDPEGSAE